MDSQQKSVRSCYVGMRRLPPCTTVTSPSSPLTPDESDSEPSPSRKSDRPVDDLRGKNPTRKCTLPDSTKKSHGPGDVQHRRNPSRSCTAVISPSSVLTPDVSDSEVSPPKKCFRRSEGTHIQNPNQATRSCALSSITGDSQLPEQKGGCIVFAKIWSYRLWPGVTFHGPSVGLKTSPVGHTWIFWFGDHKVSVVPFEKTTPFVKNFENVKIKPSSKSLYDLGVMEGIKNGGPVEYGANNWPLQGAKATPWEGGTKGSASVYSKKYPNKTSYVNTEMIHAVDWYPTIVHLAGADPEPGIDGVNQWSTVSEATPSPRISFVYNIDELVPHAAIRVGKYKLIQGETGGHNGWYPPPTVDTTSSYDTNLYFQQSQDSFRLYNIEEDPTEHVDLSSKIPQVLSEMKKHLALFKKTGVPANCPPDDRKGDPKNFGGFWTQDGVNGGALRILLFEYNNN